jgi:hypothetical protein
VGGSSARAVCKAVACKALNDNAPHRKKLAAWSVFRNEVFMINLRKFDKTLWKLSPRRFGTAVAWVPVYGPKRY